MEKARTPTQDPSTDLRASCVETLQTYTPPSAISAAALANVHTTWPSAWRFIWPDSSAWPAVVVFESTAYPFPPAAGPPTALKSCSSQR